MLGDERSGEPAPDPVSHREDGAKPSSADGAADPAPLQAGITAAQAIDLADFGVETDSSRLVGRVERSLGDAHRERFSSMPVQRTSALATKMPVP